MVKIIVFFLIIGLSYSTSLDLLSAEGENDQEKSSLYLPGDVIPKTYTLTIITNLEEDNFSYFGDVVIEIICKTETNKIVLHAKDLNIDNNDVEVKLVLPNGTETEVKIKPNGFEDKDDFYSIELIEKLVPGNKYKVFIPFESVLNENLFGYFKISYTEAGEKKWLAATKFSPSNARQCFPCMDEPALKAKFKIFLGHAPNFKAISNMPIEETNPLYSLITSLGRIKIGHVLQLFSYDFFHRTVDEKEDWKMDVFYETESTSTFLIAFALTEFEYYKMSPVKGIDKEVDAGIWIRKDLSDRIDLAKTTLSGALRFYTQYLGIDYGLSKLDLVFLPEQETTAVENYGMITIKEDVINYDPKSSNVMDKYRTAQVICHEICQQWFGNYVTMRWWNDLWLTESFASYFEDICVNFVFPEWNSLDQMMFQKYLNALAADEGALTHPIVISIENPTEISQYLDPIIYDKATIVIRMIKTYMGEKVFQQALKHYLKKYQFSSATSDDLWNMIGIGIVANINNIQLENMPIKTLMNSWMSQQGYPFITVKMDYDTKIVTLSQRRYLAEELTESNETSELCWYLPIKYATSKQSTVNKPKFIQWSLCHSPLTFHVDIKMDEWILIEPEAAAFCSVHYQDENLFALKNILMNKDSLNSIKTLDRAKILVDIFESAWIGSTDYQITFQIVQYLSNEVEYIPWNTALGYLRIIRNLLLRTDILPSFEDLVKRFLEPNFNLLGNIRNIPDDFTLYRYHKLITNWACTYNVPSCHDQCMSMFQSWQADPNPDENNSIPSCLRYVVYCEATKTGGKDVFDFMWDRYSNSKEPVEQSSIITALGCIPDENLLKTLLEWSIDSNKIKNGNDSIQIYRSVLANQYGLNLAKDFLFNYYTDILKFHGSGSRIIGEYLEILAAMFTSDNELQEFQDFLESAGDQLNGNEMIVKKSTNSIKKNISWRNKHLDELTGYLLLEIEKTKSRPLSNFGKKWSVHVVLHKFQQLYFFFFNVGATVVCSHTLLVVTLVFSLVTLALSR